MIVPIIRFSPGSIATIACRIRRCSRCARSRGGSYGGDERDDRVLGIDQRGELLRRAAIGLDHRHALVAGPVGRPQRRAVGAEQHDLRDLRAERLQRAGEHALDRLGDLGRARQRAVGLVEELELLVALALGDVGAVDAEHDRGRHQQHDDRARSVAIRTAAAIAMLELAAVTTPSIANIWRSVPQLMPPSAIAIAPAMQAIVSAPVASVATYSAIQVRGSIASPLAGDRAHDHERHADRQRELREVEGRA